MPKLVRNTALLCLALSAACAALFAAGSGGIWLTLAVTFGTAAYHLGVRLLVGRAFDTWMGNRADLSRRWYQPRPWEAKLYRLLRVKSWKDRMPTFYPDEFSPDRHTWDEIAQVMCQSELVHETNVVMSFLPLLAAVPFGAFWVFFLTSLGGALFDLSLVILQRYNRPRVVRLAQRAGSQKSRTSREAAPLEAH